MSKIQDIKARYIFDSRGYPTVEVEVILENGITGKASVPSGASTGIYEALELRDGEDEFNGKGVNKAINNILNEIRPSLVGMESSNQREIDQKMIELDGTKNKSRLGANSILPVSMAVAVASSIDKEIELFEYLNELSSSKPKMVLPTPMINIMNGGQHAQFASDFQEYMIIPSSELSFYDRLRIGSEVFHKLAKLLSKDGYPTSVGDEGGFAPRLNSNKKPLEYIKNAVSECGFTIGKDVYVGLDVASSEFYLKEKQSYNLSQDGLELNTDEFISYYEELLQDYPFIISIEDPLEQDDFEGWSKFTSKFGKSIQIVGDDFYVTNVERLQKGIEMKSSNSILIKLNQIGTLSETIDAIELASKNGMTSIISHRSGETEDTFIADLSVGLGTGQIKTGSFSRSERLSKYNRLIRIAEKL